MKKLLDASWMVMCAACLAGGGYYSGRNYQSSLDRKEITEAVEGWKAANERTQEAIDGWNRAEIALKNRDICLAHQSVLK